MVRASRQAVTIIEVVVVIGIVGFLLAILLPAVQAVRESGRRLNCMSHIAQFGRSLHNFQAVHGVFPAALPEFVIGSSSGTMRSWFSPHAQVLPFVEQQQEFSGIDFTQGITPLLPIPTPTGSTKSSRVSVAIFMCPSDQGDNRFPRNNYRVCTGPWPYDLNSSFAPGGGLGAFGSERAFAPADIRDGLSNTMGASEKLCGTGSEFDAKTCAWYSGVSNLGGPGLDPDSMSAVCGSLSGPPANFFAYAGRSWLYSGYEFTWYNHVCRPNASVVDCSALAATMESLPTIGGAYTATSNHAGGVNCLMMDGSSRFVADDIDLAVWRAMATRSGGESDYFDAF